MVFALEADSRTKVLSKTPGDNQFELCVRPDLRGKILQCDTTGTCAEKRATLDAGMTTKEKYEGDGRRGTIMLKLVKLVNLAQKSGRTQKRTSSKEFLAGKKI